MTVAVISPHRTYPAGQCTRYVADTWDGGDIGPYWGNAAQWLPSSAAAGYASSTLPRVDAIAVWPANVGGAGPDGHVAIVTAVGSATIDVRESNWAVALAPDTREGVASAGLSFILPQRGAKPMDPMDVCRGFVLTQYHIFRPGSEPAQADVDYWAARMVAEGVEAIIQTMRTTPEYSVAAAKEAQLLAAGPGPGAGSTPAG